MTHKKQQKKISPDQSLTLPADLPALLLAWYDQHARALPWREGKKPYRVWVSEIMLQQTGVRTVAPYFERFLAAFPTVGALADANEQQVLKLWEGLGYYTRARNLKKAAEIIVRDLGGQFPDTYDEIRKLPGIGPYTAGAIASICFELPAPAVDGNVARVAARISGQSFDDKIDLKQAAATALAALYPAERRGDFTQSLMELGALICVPNGAPKCDACPVQASCASFKSGSFSLPARKDKPKRKRADITALILESDGHLAIRQRDEVGLLPGLWEFPNTDGHLTEQEALMLAESWGTQPSVVHGSKRTRHIFTHVEWDILCYHIECENDPPCFIWADQRALSDLYPLPTAFKKLLNDE